MEMEIGKGTPSIPINVGKEEALTWPKSILEYLEAVMPIAFLDRDGKIRGPDFLRGFDNCTPELETSTATGNAGGDPMPLVIGPVPTGEIWRIGRGYIQSDDAGTAVDLDIQGVFSNITVATMVGSPPVIDTGTNVTLPAVADRRTIFPLFTTINDVMYWDRIIIPAGYYYGALVGVDTAIPNTKIMYIGVWVQKLKVQG